MMVPQVEWLLNGDPREVQLEALRRSFYGYKLREHRDDEGKLEMLRPNFQPAQGWGHLMEMRLGKTPTALNEFALFHKYYDFNLLIVLSPNSYKEDWAAEAEKYKLPVPAWPYEQSKLPHAINFVEKNKGKCALIVNYEATYYDQTLAFLLPLIGPKTMIAADESIKLKNPEGLFFKGGMALAKEAGVTRIMTGLPLSQGPQDFYSQGRFIRMYSGTSYYAYRGKYCKMGGFKSKKIVGVKNFEQLTAEIKGNSFIAKRRDWGNQTPASYFTVKTTLTAEQKRLYTEIDNEFVTLLEDGTEISADQVMGKLMKMQQISSGFVYTEDGKAIEIMDPRKTPKMTRLIELLEDEIPGKLVVPFHYAKSGDMLLETLAKYNPATIRGDAWMRTNSRDAMSEKARFNRDPSSRVMVLQIAAGKYGHDLSGVEQDRCSTMAFFENTYSLDDRGQIEARNTTAFQTWDNVYLDLVSSPVEKKAVDALVAKENIVETVLGAYREGKTRNVL